MEAVPELIPRKRTKALSAISAVFSGIGAVTDQIIPYTEWWSVQNQKALKAEGPLLTTIGDSICIGMGASHPSMSLAGQLTTRLSERDGVEWRVINLAIAGARMEDAIDRQLPIYNELPRPDVTFACIGSNDIVWSAAMNSVRAGIRQLSAELPQSTVFGPVAGASSRAKLVNRTLRSEAEANGQSVAEIWSIKSPPIRQRMATDRFHPNDLGYELMASAVLDLLQQDTSR